MYDRYTTTADQSRSTVRFLLTTSLSFCQRLSIYIYSLNVNSNKQAIIHVSAADLARKNFAISCVAKGRIALGIYNMTVRNNRRY